MKLINTAMLCVLIKPTRRNMSAANKLINAVHYTLLLMKLIVVVSAGFATNLVSISLVPDYSSALKT